MLSITGGILLGLLVGSFLNVVIYRLPIMLERDWRRQCRELLAADDATETATIQPDESPEEPFNLVEPRSRCPQCDTMITAWQNIPVISWLVLGGKCGHCRNPIPVRYPLVEIITGLLSGVMIWRFGVTLEGGATLILLWSLIALTMIDIDHQLLPDNITYPLLWLGLAFSLFHQPGSNLPFPDINSSVIGAMVGYLSLWSVYWVFKLATGKEGMGYGDFKLLAALGAWLGWQHLHVIILMSAVVGAVVGLSMMAFRNHERSVPIPFGPYLAAAGWITMLWGRDVWNFYLDKFI